jgi:hypothetical protein
MKQRLVLDQKKKTLLLSHLKFYKLEKNRDTLT